MSSSNSIDISAPLCVKYVQLAKEDGVRIVYDACVTRLGLKSSHEVAKLYVGIASEADIREIYQMCAQRLNINTIGSDDEDGGGVSCMTNASDLLSGMGGSNPLPQRTNSIVQQLKNKVESDDQLVDLMPPNLEVILEPTSANAQYNTVDFKIITDSVKQRLEKVESECRKLGIRCPYGFGPDKNLLRVSKCPIKGTKQIATTITFTNYTTSDGKRGISCYLKK